MSGRANSFHDGEARHLGIGELASRGRSFSSNSTLPDHQADSVNSPVPVILNLIQPNAPRFKDDKQQEGFQKGPDPRSCMTSPIFALTYDQLH
ncbi:hypothetical protein DSO57_1024073 [Entomophthora muscae]|uniref:Uncharacterized protein n=1 Tax=Entomophthora muscae TaxID=34485 RepID=A0ACC2RU13_9FUNG|nr:hypothetical protein DSO57_1024073 [Entomophthora muscae]